MSLFLGSQVLVIMCRTVQFDVNTYLRLQY